MIRRAKPSDGINLAALSLDVWLQTYSFEGIRTENSQFALSRFTEARFRRILNDAKYELYVHVEGLYLRGYILVNLESRSEYGDRGFEIETLYVHGPFRNRGMGRALIAEVQKRHGSRFWLYTWERNSAIEFYKNLGCKDIGTYRFKLGENTISNRVLIPLSPADQIRR